MVYLTYMFLRVTPPCPPHSRMVFWTCPLPRPPPPSHRSNVPHIVHARPPPRLALYRFRMPYYILPPSSVPLYVRHKTYTLQIPHRPPEVSTPPVTYTPPHVYIGLAPPPPSLLSFNPSQPTRAATGAAFVCPNMFYRRGSLVEEPYPMRPAFSLEHRLC